MNMSTCTNTNTGMKGLSILTSTPTNTAMNIYTSINMNMTILFQKMSMIMNIQLNTAPMTMNIQGMKQKNIHMIIRLYYKT